MLKYWRDLGDDGRWKTEPKNWEAIHYAVQAGNWPTFKVLFEEHGGDVKDLRDAREWSLLHIAATRACVAPANLPDFDSMMIIRQLLISGCDPDLETPATRAFGLDGKRHTPETLAQRVGPDFHNAYLEVLHAVQSQVADDLGIDDDTSDDEYFDCA